jgi:predicted GIY-YIG superfamily endonuclease
MNKTDYKHKMENLLNDPKTYKKLKSDPTNIFEKKNNAFIKKLLNNKEINTVDAKQLTIHNSTPPKIYGLPKIHKINVPLRPIVSCIQSPFYKLSKYLSNCLSNITGKNEYYIKDSFSFKHFVDTLVIPPNYKLLSLDVVSLYTNIPNALVQNILTKKWDLIKEHTTMSKTNFIEAVSLTLSNNYFQYETSFYQQIDGCAMGSPISSTIAQLVMEHLEESVIEGLNFDILFFKRYVDDCLMAVPENETNNILDKFNSFHRKLQFTIEIENNNTINFLDMTLTRNHKTNRIITQWYTKPTWSGRYLNYMSCHPKKQKLSVIVGLVDRAISLTSPELRPQSLDKVKDTLIKNNFKSKDINRIIKQRTFKLYNSSQIKQKNQTQNENRYVALPYTSGLSEKIAYILRKYGVRTCHRSQNKLNSIFSTLKSKTPTLKQSNVVYSIPCTCSKTYIGMTSQLLKNRLNGHKYQSGASTALQKHERETSHTFCYDNTKILNKDKNLQKLAIKEMIEVKRDKNSINDRSDVGKLGQI